MPPVMFGFASPQIVHAGLLPYTPLMWFLQDEFGHCQSPGRLVWEKVTADIPGFGVWHIGQLDLLAKTTLSVWFLHPGFEQCQSPGWPRPPGPPLPCPPICWYWAYAGADGWPGGGGGWPA